MAASNTPATSPVFRPPHVDTFRPELVDSDGLPYTERSADGPNPFFQPGGARFRAIVPVPGTMWGPVAEATVVMETGPTILPNYPPQQQIVEFPVYYPGQGWVSSANAPNAMNGS